MSEIELKPCPFCGSQGVKVVTQEHMLDWEWIECSECACSTQKTCEISDKSAADLWNTRTPQWQPIGTAPGNGEVILGWDGWDMQTTHWCATPSRAGNGKWWQGEDRYETLYWEPSHWRPLPAPPEES